MIHKNKDMLRKVISNVRGGEGSPEFVHLFSEEDLGGRMSFLSVVTLQPGESVGCHPHDTNGEVYYVLSGSVMVIEDGKETILSAGDAEFCADGHSHGVCNHTDAPASFLAVIAPDR